MCLGDFPACSYMHWYPGRSYLYLPTPLPHSNAASHLVLAWGRFSLCRITKAIRCLWADPHTACLAPTALLAFSFAHISLPAATLGVSDMKTGFAEFFCYCSVESPANLSGICLTPAEESHSSLWLELSLHPFASFCIIFWTVFCRSAFGTVCGINTLT